MTCYLVLLAAFSAYYLKIDPATNHWFAKTAGAKQIAQRFHRSYGTADNLDFVDVSYGLQYYLNVMKLRVPYATAAQKLQAPSPVFVAVRHIDRLRHHLPPEAAIHTLMRWPEQGEGYIHIVSNRAVAK